jgi:predicted DNA-binding ribbon-helix-helix protein
VKKDATIRARIPKGVADLLATEAKNQGVMNLSDYVRVAVLEKLSRDTKQSISKLLEN